MTATYGQHQVRNNRHVLKFSGRVLGSSTSERPDTARWSELVVYGLTNGSYIRSKVGRSLVVHSPACAMVDHRMISWQELEDETEQALHRVPCAECQPAQADPQNMVEATRYTATVAADPEQLVRLLTNGRAGRLPRLISDVIAQVCVADAAFANFWLASIETDARTVVLPAREQA